MISYGRQSKYGFNNQKSFNVTAPTNILVIDDDEIMRDSCYQILTDTCCQVKLAETGESGIEFIKNELFDVVILDLKMPGLSGMDVLKWIKEHYLDIVVIVITGHATIDSAVEAMKKGAYDFLPKPFTPDELRVIVNRAIEKRNLTLENLLFKHEQSTVIQSYQLVGKSDEIKKIHEMIKKVGPTDSTVLITGESGTGKELVAKAIHGHSKRKDKPFVPVDCSTLVENLFESELFGHVKGSFTGATATKHGRLELANGGTIFFDEISNIGINVQAKLLRAIQEKEIFKVGSNQAIQIDIRIIAATNADLREEVKEGRFREDLFYRLGVVPIHLPPLRERKSDIPLLVNYFIDKLNKKRRKSVQKISQPVMQALTNYDWPGNIRELENAIERAIVLTDNDTIEPKDLYYYGLLTEEASTFKEITLNEMEKQHITNMLALHHGHKIKTAQALGINRKTLRLKMKKYGIS